MVDRMDQGAIPAQVVAQSYDALWKLVSKALYRTHVEGKLKVSHLSPVMSINSMAAQAYYLCPCVFTSLSFAHPASSQIQLGLHIALMLLI